jgi:putative iron-dependent peroxidase
VTRPVQVQPVLSPLTEAAIFLVLTVESGGERVVRDLIADFSGLSRAVGFRGGTDGQLACVLGIGAELWDRLFGGPRPRYLHPFPEIAGDRHRAPSTPGDLLLHIRARRMDLCFEFAAQITQRLATVASVVDETFGFQYFDERDLLGFVDGTENPTGEDAQTAATIGDEDPDFAGGSYVVVQKYLHDLDAWNAISVAEQERVIGRSKMDNVEMPDDVKPANSHVALNTVVDDDGDEVQIVRDNMPFGTFGSREFGTFFIAYACDPAHVEVMLRNMFIGRPPGNTDRILDFSTAVTGSLFFIPPAGLLDDPPPASSGPAVAATAPSHPASANGSLGVGSLRRTR